MQHRRVRLPLTAPPVTNDRGLFILETMPLGRPGATVALLLALGCVRDDWVFAPPRDSGVDAGAADLGPADSGPPPCVGGLVRCGGVCVRGPVNLYRGNGNANDSAGPHNGAIGNNVGFAPGRFGDAFVFDGARRYVALPAPVGDLGTGDMTITLWFNSTGDGVILARRAGCWNVPPYSGQEIDLMPEGRIGVELFPSGRYSIIRPTPLVNDGAWHHLAFVRRGATVSLVLDGRLEGSVPVTGSFDDPTGSPTYIGVGRCVPGAPGSNGTNDGRAWIVGQIDEVAYFDRALSGAELAAAAQGLCEL